MLHHIRLQRFKKFQDIEVYLRPFTVLMGENSSGKTTVLQAINSALIILTTQNLIFTTGDKLKIKDVGFSSIMLPGIRLLDISELFYAKVTGGGNRKDTGGARIELFDEKENIYRIQIRLLFGSLNIKCLSSSDDLSKEPSLHLKPPLFISGFVGLLPSEERVFPLAIQDRLRSGQVSSIIRNLLFDTYEKAPEGFEKLKARLAKDFDFNLDNISFDQMQDLYVTAQYKERLRDAKGIALDFNSSGSGFMQVLQILAPIYRFCPDESLIVLLDEPDAHLHPNLQSALAGALRDIQKELGIQIIISTHSTSIIKAADPSEVVPISANLAINKPLTNSYDVDEQISARIDSREFIDTYDLGKSVLSGKLIFFEDSDISIVEAFDKVLGTKCFSGANTVPVLKGKGKDNKVPFQLNEVLKEFVGHNVEIHFVLDGDGLDDEWRTHISEYAKKKNVVLHQLQRHEIENYLLSPALIFRALSQRHPNKEIPSEHEIVSKITTFLEQTISITDYNFDRNLEDSIYKTANLVRLEEYQNRQTCVTKAIEMRKIYRKFNSLQDLLIVGMGKEALKELRSWINQDLKLNFSTSDILNNLERTDIPDEIPQILSQLRSQESKPVPPE